MTEQQFKMVLTRVGDGSSVILGGDEGQSNLPEGLGGTFQAWVDEISENPQLSNMRAFRIPYGQPTCRARCVSEAMGAFASVHQRRMGTFNKAAAQEPEHTRSKGISVHTPSFYLEPAAPSNFAAGLG